MINLPESEKCAGYHYDRQGNIYFKCKGSQVISWGGHASKPEAVARAEDREDQKVNRTGIWNSSRQRRRGVKDGERTDVDHAVERMTAEQLAEADQQREDLGMTEAQFRPEHHEQNADRRDRGRLAARKRAREECRNDELRWPCQFCRFKDKDCLEPDTAFDCLNASWRTSCFHCSKPRADLDEKWDHQHPWTQIRWRCPKCFREPEDDKRITVSGLDTESDICEKPELQAKIIHHFKKICCTNQMIITYLMAKIGRCFHPIKKIMPEEHGSKQEK